VAAVVDELCVGVAAGLGADGVAAGLGAALERKVHADSI
jgi:hypothetical protein